MHNLVQLTRPDLLVKSDTLNDITAYIVLCDTFTYHVGKYISKKNNAPLILIKHNIEWKYVQNQIPIVHTFLKHYEHYILQKADAIITISMNEYRYFMKYVPEEKLYYIPPIIDATFFCPDGISHDFGNDRLNLLFFGSLDRVMNINALKFIKNSLIPLLEKRNLLDKIRVNIFGHGTPPEYLKLKEDKNINFLGSVDDPARYIRGADLVLVPVTNQGGVKIRILEALMCGKPVVVMPEASIGIPNKIKEYVFIEKDAEGFLKVIKQFLEGSYVKKIDTDFINSYLRENITVCNIVDEIINKNKSKNDK
ncbi:hypothetical protein A3K78_11040 [Candidatus Bathyarchaeota archaeon RBG_13_52_12]|nr:MAG: hypothetical protein A3K78_11040 [Candidatus Bathyarchaeota archaeon RBG_13_52_12]